MRFYAIVLCLLSVQFVTAQTSNNPYASEIQSRLDQYMNVMAAGNFTGSLDFTYPKLFTIVPKAIMAEQLDKTFNNEDGIKIRFGESNILKIHDEVITVKEELFTLVDYDMIMNMSIEDTAGVSLMLPMFSNLYGENNVTYNADTQTFVIKMNNQMIAIKTEGDWFFIENKKEQSAMRDMIFDKEVIEKLGL